MLRGEKYKMYKLYIQIYTLLPSKKSPWCSKVHAKCKQVGLYSVEKQMITDLHETYWC